MLLAIASVPRLRYARTRMPRATLPWTIALAVTFFACVAPTLHWLEFSNSMEVLNVGTVLEIHRGGPWLLPTLEGKPRIEKPPLTAWITSLATRRSTTASLDRGGPAHRAAAYDQLAFDVRWPALLAGALTLLATYALGTIIARDGQAGLVAAAICASNYFFLRFSRFATTDVQLMLWVTLANVFIARCILDGVTWPGALGAGAALGLAFMAKGPVAFVQTLVPAAVYLLIVRAPIRRFISAPVIVGLIVMLAIASWWFIVVAMRVPGVVHTWLSETNPAGGDRLSSKNIFVYGIILAFMLPWSIFLVHGCAMAIVNVVRRENLRSAYPTMILFTTIIVMSCFADRKERYILPMVPIASVIAAQSVVAMLRRTGTALPDWSHWTMLLAFALVPLLGITRVVTTIDGRPWFRNPTFPIASMILLVVIVLIGNLASARRRWAIAVTPFVLMMFLQVVGVLGYRQSREGSSEMRPLAEFIREKYPTAQVYNYRGERAEKRAPVDLSIYLNRPTPLISDPTALPPSDRPQIYVTVSGRNDPEPQPAPAWRFLHKVRRDKDWYYAFVRE